MSKQIQYVNSLLRPVVVMSNFTHLDESIVTPKRARISKLLTAPTAYIARLEFAFPVHHPSAE